MKTILLTLSVSFQLFIFAQVKIGDNHENLNSNSLLELESTNKGILMPRLALTSTSSFAPLASHVAGMLVYNTATANDVQPGLYINDGTRWISMVVAVNPVGTVITKASNAVPSGYLYCNGQAVSRTTYAALFADIGTTYGVGDGSTTFNVPDFRGYFLRGQNDGSGNDPDAASRTNSGNGTTGDAIGTKQAFQLESHTHTLNNATAIRQNSPGPNFASGTAGYGNMVNITVNNTGGNETRPKNINVKYYIKF